MLQCLYCHVPPPVLLQWDYTRIKLEEPPEQAALRRLHAAAGGSGNLTGRLGDLERQVGGGGLECAEG